MEPGLSMCVSHQSGIMFKNRQLLKNEEEFLRLNSEIDSKTRELMEQIDQVKKKQDSDQETLHQKWNSSKEIAAENSNSFKISESEIDATYRKIMKRFTDKSENEEDCAEDDHREETRETGFEESRKAIESAESNEGSNGEPENCENGKRGENIESKNGHGGKPNNLTGATSSVSTMNLGQGIVFPVKLTRYKSESKLKEKLPDGILPESMKGMGQENIMRFLKAKIKVLTEQLDVMHDDEKKHIEKIKELQGDRERVAEDRDKWIQQANIAKNVLMKHEQQASNIIVQMQNLQAENGHLKREVEKLKKELKQISQISGSNEVRLNRSLEEAERLKASLRRAKQDEKDLRETHRKKTDELSASVKRLDKQRVELLHAFKKQLVIIDNLKKQKGYIEAGKIVKSIEDDFMEFLDWNPNDA